MALDHRRRPANGLRLDNIGIKSALHQEVDVADSVRLFIEHIDKCRANDLALSFRIGRSPQRQEEPFAGSDSFDPQIAECAESRENTFKFVLSKHPVINKDARQAIANGTRDTLGTGISESEVASQ